MPDSQQAATGFEWMRQEFRNIEKRKRSHCTHWPFVAPTDVALRLAGSAGSVGDGEYTNPSMFRLCPAGCVRRWCGFPGVGGPSARRNHDPPNLRAQCKQTRNLCQGEIDPKAQNLVAACSMHLSLVVAFREAHNGERAGRLADFAKLSQKSCSGSITVQNNSRVSTPKVSMRCPPHHARSFACGKNRTPLKLMNYSTRRVFRGALTIDIARVGRPGF